MPDLIRHLCGEIAGQARNDKMLNQVQHDGEGETLNQVQGDGEGFFVMPGSGSVMPDATNVMPGPDPASRDVRNKFKIHADTSCR